MTETFADPVTVAAIARARAAGRRAAARGAELGGGLDRDDRGHDDDHDDALEELSALAEEVAGHLDAGRWDEARACAEELLDLAESAGQGAIWREFGLLVEEAAETGFAAAQLEAD